MPTPLKEPTTELGAAIRRARQSMHLSQPELAALMTRYAPTISLWELGKVKPNADDIVAMVPHLASTPGARRDLYNALMSLAGYGLDQEQPKADGQVVLGANARTIEGAMIRGMVDDLPDPDLRWRLVELVRGWIHTNGQSQ